MISEKDIYLFISGGLAYSVQSIFIIPLDRIKTLFQVLPRNEFGQPVLCSQLSPNQSTKLALSSNICKSPDINNKIPSLSNGIYQKQFREFSLIRLLYTTQGIKTFYVGSTAHFLMAPLTGLYITIYENTKNHFQNGEESTTKIRCISAFVARTLELIIRMPLEHHRTALQSSFLPISQNKLTVRGMFRSYSFTFLRDVPFSMIFWCSIEPLYESITNIYNKISYHLEESTKNFLVRFNNHKIVNINAKDIVQKYSRNINNEKIKNNIDTESCKNETNFNSSNILNLWRINIKTTYLIESCIDKKTNYKLINLSNWIINSNMIFRDSNFKQLLNNFGINDKIVQHLYMISFTRIYNEYHTNRSMYNKYNIIPTTNCNRITRIYQNLSENFQRRFPYSSEYINEFYSNGTTYLDRFYKNKDNQNINPSNSYFESILSSNQFGFLNKFYQQELTDFNTPTLMSNNSISNINNNLNTTWNKSRSPVLSAVAGACTGAIAGILTHPIDCLKSQAQSGIKSKPIYSVSFLTRGIGARTIRISFGSMLYTGLLSFFVQLFE